MKEIEYIKVGYLHKKIANAINKSVGDICITNEVIGHINGRHSTELGAVGLDAFGFVKFVTDNFTQILEDLENKSMLLAYVPEVKSAKIVAMSIETIDDKYFVKTAFPAKRAYLRNKKLIWIR